MKCDSCGKFRQIADLTEMVGEYDEAWIECRHCMPPADLLRYYPKEVKS